MSMTSALPLSPPSTSSRRKPSLLKSLISATGTPESPASFPGSSNSGSRKRVEFSPWTNTHESLPAPQRLSSLPRTKPIRSSSECQNNLKSILKPVSAGENIPQSRNRPLEESRSMNEMMESIVNQLSQDDRSISVDAYRTLASVIREYDEIPEEAVLKSKITTILKYIKRDLLRQAKPDESQIADTNLMTQALKVLVIFVWNREYASLLSDEHRVFILDRSIQVIVEHSAPKSVIIHYLHLLATQDFRPSLVNSSNRVPRLLEGMKTLPEHIKGNGIVSERLLVYQKLLEQAKAVMKSKANLWVEELLTGMTNPLKDIRDKAMSLGLKACLVFPVSASIASTVRSVLQRELDAERTFSSAMCRRLEKMVSAKDEVSQVPQIWAIVILLSNGLDTRVDNWVEMKDWLKVIQRCFNCSETAIRQQSILAWNRLVYVVRPHEASETYASMLAKPLAVQLERSGPDKGVKGTRTTAVSSYCNLLYYAFRPAATHKQYTRVWNEYIVKVMKSSFFDKNTANPDLACRVLIALLWNSSKSTKVWNENRALESTPVEPEELPTIDCKWVRARSAAIVEMFRVLFRYSSWGASGQSDRAYIAVAWSHFLKAIREASSKEIKPSSETKQAIATVVEFLSSLWPEKSYKRGSAHALDHALSDAQLRQITRSALQELGCASLLGALGALQSGNGRPQVLSVVFDSITSEMRKMKDHEGSRLCTQPPKAALQTLPGQYQKALELINTWTMEEIQSIENRQVNMLAETIETIVRLLNSMPEPELFQTCLSLSTTLEVLLKDEKHYFDNSQASDLTQLYQNFSKVVASVLIKFPPTEVLTLDGVFAAFFETTSDTVLERAGVIWDRYLAVHDNITLGPRLSDAVYSLADPELKSSSDTKGLEDNRNCIPSPSQAPDITRAQSPERDGPPSRQRAEVICGPSPILGSQGYQQVVARHPTAQASPTKPSSRPRSRHDDSQINFVPIESSPPADTEYDSQSLTAHQKEVRDRQRTEPAVVFPDLRSSPRPQSRSLNYGDCEFARKAAALDERPTTPTLPANHDQEPEIMASPTPRARHSTKNISDIEVPSSPPSMGDQAGDNSASPLQIPIEEDNMAVDLMLQPEVIDKPSIVVKDHVMTDESAVEVAFKNIPKGSPVPDALKTGPLDAAESQAYPPSTVDETPIHVDGAGQPVIAGQAKNGADSDEIDMLSASQLSQDLDRHLSQVVDAGPMETIELYKPQQEDNTGSDKKQRNTRKRKTVDYTLTKTKRRKSKASSQASSDGTESQVSSNADPNNTDLRDCIEITPSEEPETGSRDAVVEERRPAVSASPPKTRRGKHRKRSRLSRSQESRNSQVEVIVPAATSAVAEVKEATATENAGVDGGLKEAQVGEHHDLAMPEAENVEKGDIVEEESEPLLAPLLEMVDESAQQSTEPSIVSSLQGILDQLKSSKPSEVDLRMVDDLCFQIRFQAQVVAQQKAT
ncbi:hypothetical protein PV08_09604 [Exophiala spinifera]|uniref:Telomere-associated protein Rif1 N-terminal domain-containing protein n=1 Tax=Exophiala spinifera TaxID=91928 RepID=A0A0D1ZHB5_9EURO|nr:uncharacterized protein PV08_09604 [Exophiala spinifera]KIW12327.1 hypothetical protein PV08_09604 [Exophiala spinifera]